MNEDLAKALSETIGVLRAENYAEGQIFSAVERPQYWSRLTGRQVCFLFGGRGTGKTTALRWLAFEGQASLVGLDMAEWDAVGFYWRVETSVVTAFTGDRLDDATWGRVFAHYVNLRLVLKVLEFVDWYTETYGETPTTDADALAVAAASLELSGADDLPSFAREARLCVARFEASLNRLSRSTDELQLSVLGKPIGHLLDALHADHRLHDHHFVFALDEYENLNGYQQRVVNTLIKHAGDGQYTFKVGVKRGGIRDRSTLHPDEFLSTPADYIQISVEDELQRQGFAEFAWSVCEDRLRQIPMTGSPLSISGLFPELPLESEAELLGGGRRRAEIRAELVADETEEGLLAEFDRMTLVSACLVGYWAQSQAQSAQRVLRDALAEPTKWSNRLNNYSFAMLFTLRDRRPGVRKYYAGWSVLTHIAEGNLRYLLSLVYEALVRHVDGGGDLLSPVPPALQTEAAEQVGQRTVFELAGLHARGTELMRMVLSLGRVFSVLAAYPQGHTPEVTQFRVEWHLERGSNVEELLAAGVMHDALIGFPGDKNSARSGETKEFDYRLHPLFAPFFAYSYRRKRRFGIAARDLAALAGPTPQGTISKLLRRNARNPTAELPEQLEVLAEFFSEA